MSVFNQTLWNACVDRAKLNTEKYGECLYFTGGTFNQRGYGRVWLVGKDRTLTRVIMEAHIGRQLVVHEQVLHSCDNPRCIKMEHLRVGTVSDNMRDAYARNRRPRRAVRQPTPEQLARGTRIKSAKLNDEKVREIRRMRSEGLSFNELALHFDLSKPGIQHVCARRSWRHIE